jgi:membrane protein YqaA with SNARE-associated domain
MGSDLLNSNQAQIQPRQHGCGLSLLILAAVFIVGLQLGGLPWRYRKQLWQAQGALAGGVIGYIIGRWSAHDRKQLEQPTNNPETPGQ